MSLLDGPEPDSRPTYRYITFATAPPSPSDSRPKMQNKASIGSQSSTTPISKSKTELPQNSDMTASSSKTRQLETSVKPKSRLAVDGSIDSPKLTETDQPSFKLSCQGDASPKLTASDQTSYHVSCFRNLF